MTDTQRKKMDSLARLIASWIVLNPSFLEFLRKLTKRSRASVAQRAGVEEEDIEQLECGAVGISLKDLMSIARTFVIPPGDEDEDYIYEPASPKKERRQEKIPRQMVR